MACSARRRRSLAEKGLLELSRERWVRKEPGISYPFIAVARWTIQSRGELTQSELITCIGGGAIAPILADFDSCGLRRKEVLCPTSCCMAVRGDGGRIESAHWLAFLRVETFHAGAFGWRADCGLRADCAPLRRRVLGVGATGDSDAGSNTGCSPASSRTLAPAELMDACGWRRVWVRSSRSRFSWSKEARPNFSAPVRWAHKVFPKNGFMFM